jgi:deoxycytidine triphosphate deaminase/intein/homing endonuclease
VILSDRTIRQELAAGRIVIDPVDDASIQPSSVDLHLDRFFRVFLNHTMGHIDVKQNLEELTDLVEIKDDGVFMLHPGEFVLGSTLERVALPDDLVARLEGKSSLGRLGLLIHSSLPGSETVLVLHEGELRRHRIEDIVRKQLRGCVVGFDPETFEVGYFPISGWYEGPSDRIFEVRLASGRVVRVTAGHNMFSLDRAGNLVKVRTGELRPGTRIALPRRIPDPPGSTSDVILEVASLIPESDYGSLVVEGENVKTALDELHVRHLLKAAGYKHVDFYRARRALPLAVALQVPGLVRRLGEGDTIRSRGAKRGLPVHIPLNAELAWFLGLYVAEGYRRRNQVVISNTDDAILDRAVAVLASLGQVVFRANGRSITRTSQVLAALLGWVGTGGGAHTKRLPAAAFGWPRELQAALFEGLMDGDGSRDGQRDSYWSSSAGLVGDVLLLAQRLGLRAAAYRRTRASRALYQVVFPHREHKLLMSVPLPDQLLIEARSQLKLTQRRGAEVAGFRNPTDLNNIERRRGRDAVRVATLRRIRDGYRTIASAPDGRASSKLDRLVDGDLAWDTVVEVVDTGRVEPIFDLEVRPDGRKIENFLAGSGVFVSNTAGFVDAGWDGHLTLELSNVATLPITLYPGMKIGQISFLRMTTPADVPYGSEAIGSKYQGQRGPTASRYWENFREGEQD